MLKVSYSLRAMLEEEKGAPYAISEGEPSATHDSRPRHGLRRIPAARGGFCFIDWRRRMATTMA